MEEEPPRSGWAGSARSSGRLRPAEPTHKADFPPAEPPHKAEFPPVRHGEGEGVLSRSAGQDTVSVTTAGAPDRHDTENRAERHGRREREAELEQERQDQEEQSGKLGKMFKSLTSLRKEEPATQKQPDSTAQGKSVLWIGML